MTLHQQIMIKFKNPTSLKHMVKMCTFLTFALPLALGIVGFIYQWGAKNVAFAALLSLALLKVM